MQPSERTSNQTSADTVFRPAPIDTHTVLNQPPPLVDYDVYGCDTALTQATAVFGTETASPALSKLGKLASSAEVQRWAVEADTYTPVLRAHDRYGHRVDEVEFHPAWHSLMNEAVAAGLHAAPWASDDPAAHVTRAAGFVTWYQSEAGPSRGRVPPGLPVRTAPRLPDFNARCRGTGPQRGPGGRR